MPVRRRSTYQDLAALPPHLVGELIDGELIASPRPALPHAGAASALSVLIGGPFRFGIGGPGGWMILDEPELHLGSNVLVPDLAGWRRERMPELPDEAAFTLAPDWVCEVLSRGTEARDRSAKMPLYAREQVGHVWLVDPIVQTLEVFRRDGARWLLLSTETGDAKVSAEPFEAVELDLARLWAR